MDCKGDMNNVKKPDTIFFILNQLMHELMNSGKRVLHGYGLKKAEGGILFLLSRHPEMSQKELAEHIGMTPASITISIQKMEAEGYLIRTPKAEDKRVLQIQLTEKGQTIIQKSKAFFLNMENALTIGMSPEEVVLLKRLLRQMQENINEGEQTHA